MFIVIVGVRAAREDSRAMPAAVVVQGVGDGLTRGGGEFRGLVKGMVGLESDEIFRTVVRYL